MLHVKTYLKKSKINGIGVFASEIIFKDQLIWSLNPNIDKIIDNNIKNISTFTEIETDFIVKYAYFDKQLQKYILSSDNDKFTNHSFTPNTKPYPNGNVFAIKDISKNEELTINYFEIDELANEKLKNQKIK